MQHRHCLSDGLGTDHADCYEHEHTFGNTDGHFHGNRDQKRIFYTDPNTHPDRDADAHAERDADACTHARDAHGHCYACEEPHVNTHP